FPDVEVPCAMANIGNPSALQACIQNKVGVPSACAACLAADIECAAQKCASPCIADPGSEACIVCRNGNCASAFMACSGLPRDTGTVRCADLLGNGPTQMPLQQDVLPAFFATDIAYKAYVTFSSCACSSCITCSPNYCSGQPASAMCAA